MSPALWSFYAHESLLIMGQLRIICRFELKSTKKASEVDVKPWLPTVKNDDIQDLEDLIISKERREFGKLQPPFPSGWFKVADTYQLKKGIFIRDICSSMGCKAPRAGTLLSKYFCVRTSARLTKLPNIATSSLLFFA